MRSRFLISTVAGLALAALGAGVVTAQIEGGDRGVAAVDSSNDYEVTDIRVDVSAPTAEAARLQGWREAQRKGFTELSRRLTGSAGSLADGTLDSIVSSIVIGEERIGPTRYIARLGILFDRERTAGLLGIAAFANHSPPLVVIPIMWSAGAGGAFEQRTPWQEAWARFRTSTSEIDYIRPQGNGADPLLLNVGQTERPARGWWRTVLNLYGGTDVLIPVVRLRRQWPGGPIIADFEARHGPDNKLLSRFSLRVASSAGLGALLDEGVKRMDAVYQSALRGGYLRADAGLAYTPPTETALTATVLPDADTSLDQSALDSNAPTVAVSLQYDSPDAGAVSAVEGAVRGIPGVRSATTSSLALGGLSQMSVTYAGDAAALRSALEARGWQVLGSGATLRVRRAPRLLPPDLTPDNATAG